MQIRKTIGRQLVRLGLWLQGPALARRFHPGDRVVCHCEGSWVDGKVGTVTALNVTSTDDIGGHAVQIDGHGWTVVDPAGLRLLDPLASRNYTIGHRPDGWSEVYLDAGCQELVAAFADEGAAEGWIRSLPTWPPIQPVARV